MHKAEDWTFRVPRHELAERILLKICGGGEPDDGQFAALDDAGWTAIEAIAVRTRTANLLHRHLRASTVAVPQHTALRLADLYRRQSIYALEQKLVLGRIANLLDDKGIEHVALKGSALAYSLYDQPAMRPLRDLDILVPAERAVEAREWLLVNGFAPAPWAKSYGTEYNHQLPEIVCEQHGVTVEIHHRVFSRHWAGDSELTAMLLGTACPVTSSGHPVAYAAPLPNLLHLTVHATLHNCFDNGPLTIADIHRLWRHPDLDRKAVVKVADRLELRRSLDLLLALALEAGPIDIPAEIRPDVDRAGCFVPDALQAMFQVPAEAGQRAMMRRLETGEAGSGPLGALQKAIHPTPQKLAELASTSAQDRLRWTGYPRWVLQRGRDYLASMTNPSLREAARRDARMLQWLRQETER